MTFHQIGLCFAAALLFSACATNDEAPAPIAAPVAPAKPAAPVFVASDIMGAAAASIDALLGAPALTRQEGTGEFRRYSLSECTLIVILYPDETGASRAAHIEATALTSGREKPSVDDCLAAG